MSAIQALITIGIMAAITLLTRALPFLIFPANRKTPEFVTYLGRVLPYAIIGMLIVYCLRGVDLFGASHALPELISIAVVAGLFLWRKNSLLAIGIGTGTYMFLVQVVFVG